MIAFEQIPIDVLRYILCMLEAHDLLRVQLTCVRFACVLDDEHFYANPWRVLARERACIMNEHKMVLCQVRHMVVMHRSMRNTSDVVECKLGSMLNMRAVSALFITENVLTIPIQDQEHNRAGFAFFKRTDPSYFIMIRKNGYVGAFNVTTVPDNTRLRTELTFALSIVLQCLVIRRRTRRSGVLPNGRLCETLLD